MNYSLQLYSSSECNCEEAYHDVERATLLLNLWSCGVSLNLLLEQKLRKFSVITWQIMMDLGLNNLYKKGWLDILLREFLSLITEIINTYPSEKYLLPFGIVGTDNDNFSRLFSILTFESQLFLIKQTLSSFWKKLFLALSENCDRFQY